MEVFVKKLKSILLILFLLIIYVYIASISLIPNHIVIFEGENINVSTLWGIKLSQNSNSKLEYGLIDTIQTVTNLNNNKINQVGKFNLSLNLFDKIPLKQIDVDVIKKAKVIPLGNAIGLKLYTKGVMVVGMSEIQGENKKNYRPYEGAGIVEGDMIIKINEEDINTTDDLIKKVNESNGNKIDIKYIRNEETLQTSIVPIKTAENEYKLGLWVRDAAARSWNSNIL